MDDQVISRGCGIQLMLPTRTGNGHVRACTSTVHIPIAVTEQDMDDTLRTWTTWPCRVNRLPTAKFIHRRIYTQIDIYTHVNYHSGNGHRRLPLSGACFLSLHLLALTFTQKVTKRVFLSTSFTFFSPSLTHPTSTSTMAGPNLVSVNVKWSTKNLPVEIDTTESPAVFMSQLWTLTGVPPERQTILGLKGGKLKEDAEWTKLNLKPDMKLILMGTPDEKRLAPPSKTPTVRDDLDLDASHPEYEPVPVGPPGLINLGNTCYMNAAVQCLHTVSPLTAQLATFRGSTTALNPAEKLAASLRDVFSRLKSRNSGKVNPSAFLDILRQANPQFAERANTGFYMQQDAEECWGELLNHLANALRSKQQSSEGKPNPVDALFRISMRSQDQCEETDESVDRKENIRALKCHISSSVSHVNQGIKESLSETIEKTSEELGRSAKWSRVSRIETLPPFLAVQLVRFFWKQTESIKAKILRKVTFPLTLDVFDFCTDELKEKLTKKRDVARAEAEAKIHAEPKESDAGVGTAAGASTMTDVVSEEDDSKLVPAEIGQYELCAVLTHKGRAADSGHYVAWVKDRDGKWYQLDDDKVSVHSEEEVKKLCGGGDWHMAYMCLYRAKNTM